MVLNYCKRNRWKGDSEGVLNVGLGRVLCFVFSLNLEMVNKEESYTVNLSEFLFINLSVLYISELDSSMFFNSICILMQNNFENKAIK